MRLPLFVRACESLLVREVRRVPRAGVIREADLLSCPEMGLRVPAASDDALDLGLCSDELWLRAGRWSCRLPPWTTSRAVPMPSGVLRAAAGALRHFSSGMGLVLVTGAGTLALGVLTGARALVALAVAVLLLLCSVLVHEIGHVLAYRLAIGRAAPAALVVRGLHCRVVRLRGGRRADASVVLAGSLAPVLAAAPVWLLAGWAPALPLSATLIALGHVAGLLLPVGDGASLREILRSRRRARVGS